MWRRERFLFTMVTVVMLASFVVAQDNLPPGRVGVHGFDSFILRGSQAEVESWQFLSSSGVLVPDADGDASPWQTYLSNRPT